MIVGSVFVILGGLISYTAMHILTWASFKTGILVYDELIEHSLGKVYKSFILAIFNFLESFGAKFLHGLN